MLSSKPRVLFATRPLHHPPIGGPTLRIENSIKALSQISDLYLYSRVSKERMGGQSALSFYENYCTDIFFAPHTKRQSPGRSAISQALKLLGRLVVGRHTATRSDQLAVEDFNHLLVIARKLQADVIWLGYGNIAYPLLTFLKSHSDYKVVVDTDSVWSRFILRGLPFAKTEGERQKIIEQGATKELEERQGTRLADVTTAVSEVDAEYYRRLAERPEQVRIFSNVVDVDTYRLLEVGREQLAIQRPCIYLAGTYWPGSPMEDATRWVLQYVFPLVQRDIPDIHFYIVGQGSDKILRDVQVPAVTITGQLPSVLPYLLQADVALVPLRFESGTRFKILESGACGIPVVSTTLGAEGLPVCHREHVMLADDPESFAQAIVTLVRDRDLARRLSHRLHDLVTNHYSLQVLVREGGQILDYLTGSKPHRTPRI